MRCADDAIVLLRSDLTTEAKLKRGQLILFGIEGISLPLGQQDGTHESLGGVDLLPVLRLIIIAILLQVRGIQTVRLRRQLLEVPTLLKGGVESVGDFQLLYSFGKKLAVLLSDGRVRTMLG